MKLYILASCFLIAGCATSTGVVPIGQDTYMISGSANRAGGSSGAVVKANAFREATQFCAETGKKLQVVSTHQTDIGFGVNASAEIQFMCLDPNSPEYSRPNIKKDADKVIEVRQDIKLNNELTSKSDIYSALAKIDELKKRGIISEVEFDILKSKLLN